MGKGFQGLMKFDSSKLVLSDESENGCSPILGCDSKIMEIVSNLLYNLHFKNSLLQSKDMVDFSMRKDESVCSIGRAL